MGESDDEMSESSHFIINRNASGSYLNRNCYLSKLDMKKAKQIRAKDQSKLHKYKQ